MKTRKLLSVLLAVLMLLGSLSVVSFAADTAVVPKVYNVIFSVAISQTEPINPVSLRYELVEVSNSLKAFNGSEKPKYVIDTPFADTSSGKVYYSESNPADFLSAFEANEVIFPVTMTINSDKFYGELCLELVVHLTDAAGEETIFTNNRNFVFDTVYSAEITTMPKAAEYIEHQHFDPRGLVISTQTSKEHDNGIDARLAAYDISTEHDFSFGVGLGDELECGTYDVGVYYKDTLAGFVRITVSHNYSNWTENDDASFFRPQTTTGTCTVCGATTHKYIDGTEGYLKAFEGNDIFLQIMAIVAGFFKAVDIFRFN